MEIVHKLNSEIQLRSDFLKKKAMIIKTDILSSKVRKNATTSNLMLYAYWLIVMYYYMHFHVKMQAEYFRREDIKTIDLILHNKMI